MAFDKLIVDIQNYIQANPAGSISAGVILLFLLFKRPKIFIVLFFIGLVAVGMQYIFTKLSGAGLGDKKPPFIN
ncbi:MAG TPA: hypothetical protein ENG83_00100 [Nitrospirae bacterium]|nr:hypothetical protein BMS3Abin06_02763 [bacterium BMS3Abin06]HDH10605.1 hypothetical protein [Nitrospirota bacterium]HDZ00271.1 hypothetical protein [Nitrospirota bacterium]